MPVDPKPPPPPSGGGKTEGTATLIQWMKDVITGPYSDKVKEETITNAVK